MDSLDYAIEAFVASQMDSARELVQQLSPDAKGDDLERLAKIVVCREALIGLMTTARPGDKTWDTCSEKIADLESRLAPWGLV